MNSKILLILTMMGLFTTSCYDTQKNENKKEPSVDHSATIYFNGDIITMDGESPTYAEAVVSKEGRIAYVGTLEKAESQFKNTASNQIQVEEKLV